MLRAATSTSQSQGGASDLFHPQMNEIECEVLPCAAYEGLHMRTILVMALIFAAGNNVEVSVSLHQSLHGSAFHVLNLQHIGCFKTF